jgi:hypothetical protein
MKIKKEHCSFVISILSQIVSLILIIIGSININNYRRNPFSPLDYETQKNTSVSVCYNQKCLTNNISCEELNIQFEVYPDYLIFFSGKACDNPLCSISEISKCLDSFISAWKNTYYIQDRIIENGLFKYNIGIIMVCFGIPLFLFSGYIVHHLINKQDRTRFTANQSENSSLELNLS